MRFIIGLLLLIPHLGIFGQESGKNKAFECLKSNDPNLITILENLEDSLERIDCLLPNNGKSFEDLYLKIKEKENCFFLIDISSETENFLSNPYHINLIFECIIINELDKKNNDSKVASVLQVMDEDVNIGSPNDKLLFNELTLTIENNEAHRMLALYLIWLYDYQLGHKIDTE